MLPSLLILGLETKPLDIADSFIGECGKAVLQVREGVWGMEGDGEGGKTFRVVCLTRGKRSLIAYLSDGKVISKMSTEPTSTTTVDNVAHKVERHTFPAVTSTPKPLEPIEPGNFQFNLNDDYGFILRANPGFSDARIEKGGAVETLRAKMRKSDGTEAQVVLVRDSKTKRPKDLLLDAPTAHAKFHFFFESRSVSEAELTIDPASYQGFEEVATPSRR